MALMMEDDSVLVKYNGIRDKMQVQNKEKKVSGLTDFEFGWCYRSDSE